MKKFILCLALCGGLFLTGCGNTKTLTCTMEDESLGMKMAGEAIINFNGDKVKTAKVSMEFTLPESLADQIDEFKELMGSQSEDTDYAKYEVTSKDNTVTVTAKLDATKMTDEQLEEQSVKGTYEEVKAAFEEEGYTCK